MDNNGSSSNGFGQKLLLILVVIIALYGFYVMGRNLFSGEFSKIMYVVIGVPFVWWLSGKNLKKYKDKQEKDDN